MSFSALPFASPSNLSSVEGACSGSGEKEGIDKTTFPNLLVKAGAPSPTRVTRCCSEMLDDAAPSTPALAAANAPAHGEHFSHNSEALSETRNLHYLKKVHAIPSQVDLNPRREHKTVTCAD